MNKATVDDGGNRKNLERPIYKLWLLGMYLPLVPNSSQQPASRNSCLEGFFQEGQKETSTEITSAKTLVIS